MNLEQAVNNKNILADKIGQLEQIVKDLESNGETATRIAFTFPSKTISLSNYTDREYAELEKVFVEEIKNDLSSLKMELEPLEKVIAKLSAERQKIEAERKAASDKQAKEIE